MTVFSAALNEATRLAARNEVRQLAGDAGEARRHLWSRLVDSNSQLCDQATRIMNRPLPTQLRTMLTNIRTHLVGITSALVEHLQCLNNAHKLPAVPEATGKIRLACGCPGVIGCTDISGKLLRLDPIINERTGVIKTMKSLHIDIIGLTGARLPPGWAPPISEGLSSECRWSGGTSFASVAAIWKTSLPVRTIPNLGTNRLLWLEVGENNSDKLRICFVYLPPSNDDDWLASLTDLERDLTTILDGQSNANLARVILMGDFNYEPRELDGETKRSSRRRRAWSKFMDCWPLELHNPVSGLETRNIFLSGKNRTVTIKEGTTRHGSEKGSSIDLGLGTADVRADMLIHNGWHCVETAACSWPLCKEFTGSDHFVTTLDTDVDGVVSSSDAAASPVFPGCWNNTERWNSAVDQAPAAVAELGKIMRDANDCLVLARKQANDLQRWLVDSLALLQVALGGAIRDAWIQPSNNQARPANYIMSRTSTGAVLTDEQECEEALKIAHAHGEVKTSTLHRCYRWLKPRQVHPRRRMRKGGNMMSEEATHQAWCDAVGNQSGDLSDIDEAYRQDISNRAAQYTAKAMSERGTGPLDSSLKQQEVGSITESWDASPSIPADLLPRTLFKCRHAGWDYAVWQLQLLTSSHDLALRPALWRYSTLLAVHKRGETDWIEHYRLIFVKVQMGLLQQAILSGRMLPSVRNELEAGQSGYARGVEDPVLLLHELIALRRGLLLPTWYLMGDFKKAFPRTWREDVLVLCRSISV